MVMLTSDGASVMLGRVNGVTAQLQRQVPHLAKQHCVAHREDLGITNAWEKIKLMSDIETLMRTVYTIFSRSPNKKHSFEEIAAASDNDAITFRPLNEVRWLSRHFALNAIIRNYESLTEYFKVELETSNDPIAKYCLKKLQDPQIHIALEVVNKVHEDLAALCKAFQKSGVTSIDALDLAHAKIHKIKAQYLGGVPNWSEKVRILMQSYTEKDVVIDGKPVITFVEAICSHLEERFPENEFQDWIAFDVLKLKFGNEQISSLCKRYALIPL